MVDFKKFEVLSFNCYGTLIDWEQGIANALLPVLQAHRVKIDAEAALNLYAGYESQVEAGGYLPYKDVLRAVMDHFAREFKIDLSATERNVLVDSIGNWPAFADTADSLKSLKRHYRLAIISNVDIDLFERTARHLGASFDWVITASQVGAYKPDKRIFEAGHRIIGVAQDRWLHVAQSLFHDIAPANVLGISSVWINRRHGRGGSGATPIAQARPDAEFGSLAAFTQAAASEK